MEYLWASEPMLKEAKANPNVEVVSGMQDIPFDKGGKYGREVASAVGGLKPIHRRERRARRENFGQKTLSPRGHSAAKPQPNTFAQRHIDHREISPRKRTKS